MYSFGVLDNLFIFLFYLDLHLVHVMVWLFSITFHIKFHSSNAL